MKKITVLLLSTLFIFCAFSSCGDDDDEYNGAIVGKWKYLRLETNVVLNPENDAAAQVIRNYVESEYGSIGEYLDMVIEFRSNGKVYLSGIQVGSYSVNGDVVKYSVQGVQAEDKVVVNGNNLVLSSEIASYFTTDVLRNLGISNPENVNVKSVSVTEYYQKQ